MTVLDLVKRILQLMGSELAPVVLNEASNEIRHQYLSASRARTELSWSPLFTLEAGPGAHHLLVPGVPAQRDRNCARRFWTWWASTARRPFRRARSSRGSSTVPVSGKVFDAAEMRALVDSSLDFWLTTGRFAAQFEREFARCFGVRDCLLVNSGSSANLLAVSALTSPKLGDRRLQPGDEVITVAAGFPTTVNPIIQNDLVPVFVDVTLPTYNVDVAQLEAALSSRTRAIILAHTLGNPFDLDAVTTFAAQARSVADRGLLRRGRLHLSGPQSGHLRRSGDRQLLSRAPHHHGRRRRRADRSAAAAHRWWNRFRDWGRDCWCAARQGQHLRQALRLATRRACPAATTTSTPTRTSATT